MTLYSNDREKILLDSESVYILAHVVENEIGAKCYESAYLTAQKLSSQVSILTATLERLRGEEGDGQSQ